MNFDEVSCKDMCLNLYFWQSISKNNGFKLLCTMKINSYLNSFVFSILIFSLFVCAPFALFAQTENLKLSLKEAIEYGLKNRKDVQNQEISVKISENEIEKIRTRSIPQLSAGLDFRYNSLLAPSFTGAGLFGNPEPLILRFGAPHSNNVSLNAYYELFNPTTFSDKQIAQKNIVVQQTNTEKYVIDIKFSISQAYYAALLSEEKAKFSTANLARTEQYFKEGKEKIKNTGISQNDFDRLRLDYENAKINYEEEVKNLLLSKMNLANQLGTSMNVNISLSESLEGILKSLPSSIIAQTDISKRVEMRQAHLFLEQHKLQMKKQDRLFMPTFALYGTWATSQLSSDFQLFNGQWWFPYHFVGFSVNMKLFDGLSRNRTKNEYRMRILQSENTIQKLQSDLNYEVASSKMQLQNAYSKLKTAKNNYALAEDIIKTATQQFKEGKITTTELNNAENSLSNSQNNLITFYYNFIIALLNYQKAVGEL